MPDATEISDHPLLASRVRLREHVAFWVDGVGQDSRSVLVDLRRERSFHMQVWQGWVLQQLDGTRPVQEVLAHHATEALHSEETLRWLDTMIRWLCANGMAEMTDANETTMARPPGQGRKKASLPAGLWRWSLLAAYACVVAALVVLHFDRPRQWLVSHLIHEPVVLIPPQEPPLPPLPLVDICTPVSGTLTEFLVSPGDHVEAGTPIARVVDLAAVSGLVRLRDEIQRCRDRRDGFFREGDDTNYQLEIKQLADLAHELGEREFAAAPALVPAPRRGVVRSLNTQLEGRGLLPGEAIGTLQPDGPPQGEARSVAAATPSFAE